MRKWMEMGADDSGQSDGLECVLREKPKRRQLNPFSSISNNVYVRIVGIIKTFANKRHIAANHIHVIEDKNEIQFHICEVTYVHLVTTRGLVRRLYPAPCPPRPHPSHLPAGPIFLHRAPLHIRVLVANLRSSPAWGCRHKPRRTCSGWRKSLQLGRE